ncbi:MAG: type II secretion system protein GspJ [Planctomycetota bacterium]|jgi:general secretion pathway protein J
MKIYLRKNGFTLVETLVASTIGAFIALVAVGTLRTITVSAKRVDGNIKAASEVRFASNMIATDLVNLYREQNFRNMKLIGATNESAENSSVFTFYTVGRAKARIDQPEADVYEVEYFLKKDEAQSDLYRRLWPNPDPNDEDPGGILTVIAEDIEFFQVRFFDGQEWSEEWPEEMEVTPQLVEVIIMSKPSSWGSPAMDSIMVNLVRSTGATLEALESGEEGNSQESGT